MDMNQYLDIFVEESRENLQNLNTSLLELERDPCQTGMLNDVFRVAHTLKGMSGTMGYTRMQKLTHVMEDVLDLLRNGQLQADERVVTVLFQCLDALENYLNQIVTSGNEGNELYAEIIDALTAIKSGNAPAPVSEKKKEAAATIASEIPASSGMALLPMDIYDISVLGKAIDSGRHVMQIQVVLDKGCMLKAARAFIVFQILESHAEVMKSSPKVEDIEDERFDYSFTVVVISKEDEVFFVKEINSVAEIEAVHTMTITHALLGSAQDVLPKDADITGLEAKSAVAEKTDNNTGAPDATKSKTQKTGKTVRVDIERLDVLMNLVSELIIVKTRLDDVKGNDVLGESVEYLERITTSLHDAVMKVRMVPVETVFNRFPRMIRDVAKDMDKDIDLVMSGEETELDRTVIDEVGDPLIHILRNSADHGLETKEQREKTGKPLVGKIWLRAYQDGNNVVIEVEDDGRGVNIAKVRQKIVERGLETREMTASLTDKEVIAFLFKPSFSTAEKVTDLSGRGVGLDVVKTKIEALGGIVELESVEGKGSKTIIRLPLTLAIIQALLVRIGAEKYALPLGAIREIDNISPGDIQMVRNQEVIMLRNTVIPIVRLGKVLGVQGGLPDSEKKQLTVVVVRKGDKLSGFVVDSLIGQYEVVIKSLGKLMSGVKWIAGATILGDGNVALIVDVNALAL